MAQPPKTPLLQSAVSTAGKDKGSKKRNNVKIVDVWAHNMEAELELIRGVVPDYPIVAVTASPDVAAARAPAAEDTSYDTFRFYIDGLHFGEVSLAFTNPRGDLALRRFWRFHLGDFDAAHLRFFVEMGVEVPAHRASAARLGAALMAFETLVNPRVAWVTYDGAADLAYLIRCIGGGMQQPLQRHNFLLLCRTFFPAMYDLKVLAMHGELEVSHSPSSNNALLDEAPAPEAIMAGSSAFAGCLGDPATAARMERYRGVLFGFDDDSSGTTASYGYGEGEHHHHHLPAISYAQVPPMYPGAMTNVGSFVTPSFRDPN